MLVAEDPARLEYAVLQVSGQAVRLETPLCWAERNERALWYELVSCILGSKVSFEHAQAATEHLIDIGLLDITNAPYISNDFEDDITHTLSLPIYPPLTRSGKGRKYRYYRLERSTFVGQ